MDPSVEKQEPKLPQVELLLEIEEQGTPLRIDGNQETYYVLSATQLRALMGRMLEDVNDIDNVTGFTLEDFGLTKADLNEYYKTHKAQHERVSMADITPLSKDLSDQLSEASGSTSSDGNATDTKDKMILHELEAAMLANLQAAASID